MSISLPRRWWMIIAYWLGLGIGHWVYPEADCHFGLGVGVGLLLAWWWEATAS